MRRFHRNYRLAMLTLLLAAGQSISAWAVPYASSVRNLSGTDWEFVLNEAADSVTVLRDGGNAVTLPGTVGRHRFSMMNFNAFSIEVSKSAGRLEFHYRSEQYVRRFHNPQRRGD